MAANRKRPHRIHFYVDDAELALFEQKMAAANIRNREAYIRKMCLDGFVLRLDFSDVRRMAWLLSNATSNLNQIAKRVNEGGGVFASDVRAMQENYEKLWEFVKGVMGKLAKL